MTKEQLAKEYRKTTPNQMYGDELGFLAGYEACLKTIKDKINALKSKLAAEKTEKMSKILNQDLIKELEVKIKTLEELI
jgi:hypothetical protein